MRRTLATFALAAVAVLGGSGVALAHTGPDFGGPDFSNDNDVVVVDHTVVVCGDFSFCAGD
ncbi:hypothetical protein ACGFYP_12070 [Streptomyces sp. NPDC048370]|uniref:hypothetical protein n=1 Tax=unclassified Streptomyces TaxID=2593676 RepID=UPI00340B57C2